MFLEGAIVADVALAAPGSGIDEIAGPERAPFNEIVARYLNAVGDPREVVRDPMARYWAAGSRSARWCHWAKRPSAASLSTNGSAAYSREPNPAVQTKGYEVSPINMNWDVFGKPASQAGQFFYDRRINVPYGENIWFTQAPLRTADHIAPLKELAE